MTDLDLAFIYDPNKFINQQIKVYINVLCRKAKYDFIRVEDRLNSEISKFEELVKAEINKKKESFILEQEKKRESELNIDSSANDDSIPILIFGKTKTSDDFINELKSTINILSSFLKDVEQNIQNEVIKEEIFLKPKEIRNAFEKISLLLTARFTDNTKSQSITYQLNELKETYSLLILYADDFEHELSDTIRIYYLSFPNNKCELFTHQYQLPFPSQEKVMTLENEISFDSFAGAEFPSLPILFIEKNKENKDAISCCFDSVECSIGPIVPSFIMHNKFFIIYKFTIFN